MPALEGTTRIVITIMIATAPQSFDAPAVSCTGALGGGGGGCNRPLVARTDLRAALASGDTPTPPMAACTDSLGGGAGGNRAPAFCGELDAGADEPSAWVSVVDGSDDAKEAAFSSLRSAEAVALEAATDEPLPVVLTWLSVASSDGANVAGNDGLPLGGVETAAAAVSVVAPPLARAGLGRRTSAMACGTDDEAEAEARGLSCVRPSASLMPMDAGDLGEVCKGSRPPVAAGLARPNAPSPLALSLIHI